MKIKNMLARCIVKLVSDSEYSFTALHGENMTTVEHLQEFGFASKKPEGEDANGIALFYGGDRGNSSLLVLEVPKFKPELEKGEAALFNAFNALIKLTVDGNIELNGSDNLGLIKIKELTDKLNAYVTEVKAHTHPVSTTVVIAGVGSGTGTGTASATVSTISSFDKADYENDKVVH